MFWFGMNIFISFFQKTKITLREDIAKKKSNKKRKTSKYTVGFEHLRGLPQYRFLFQDRNAV